MNADLDDKGEDHRPLILMTRLTSNKGLRSLAPYRTRWVVYKRRDICPYFTTGLVLRLCILLGNTVFR